MDKLLQWSIDSASRDANSTDPVPKPDPKLLAQLFGAPDEAAQMRSALATACDTSVDLTNRETALDNLEMLVENLDNANNLENMNMWPHLIGLLDDESNQIRLMAAWVIGTAVQNNPKSQEAFVAKDGSIDKLVELAHDKDGSVDDEPLSVKALYALTSSLGHCESAFSKFAASNDAWEMVRSGLQSSSTKIQARIVSLIQALCSNEGTTEVLVQHGIVQGILDSLSVVHENEVVERMARLLSILSTECGYKFGPDQAKVSDFVAAAVKQCGLDADEVKV